MGRFVAAHPMAGAETAGLGGSSRRAAARRDLGGLRLGRVARAAGRASARRWTRSTAGSSPASRGEHDAAVARASHVPHVGGAALAGSVVGERLLGRAGRRRLPRHDARRALRLRAVVGDPGGQPRRRCRRGSTSWSAGCTPCGTRSAIPATWRATGRWARKGWPSWTASARSAAGATRHRRRLARARRARPRGPAPCAGCGSRTALRLRGGAMRRRFAPLPPRWRDEAPLRPLRPAARHARRAGRQVALAPRRAAQRDDRRPGARDRLPRRRRHELHARRGAGAGRAGRAHRRRADDPRHRAADRRARPPRRSTSATRGR